MRESHRSVLLTLLGGLGLTACASNAPVGTEPADRFLSSIATLEGKSFEGQIVANRPVLQEDPFTGKRLVMHVRHVGDDRIEIPLHVGDDRSRTWILTRTGSGLRLKHDHRHRDGSEDAVTQYGGDTVDAGSAHRQEFPVDTFSKRLFEQNGLPASVTNVWAMEISGQRFAYELAREGRLFRVEFDLSKQVPNPPTPWGW